MSRLIAVVGFAMFLAVGVRGESPGDEHARAGQSQEISRFARPFDPRPTIGYYVGGGAVSRKKADPRDESDGTWGFDYSGWLVRRRVDLGWWHGRRNQGGTGAYRTDGPKLLP